MNLTIPEQKLDFGFSVQILLRLKVFAPIEEKLLEIVFSKAETPLRIPTNAIIPIAIIKTVKTVLRS